MSGWREERQPRVGRTVADSTPWWPEPEWAPGDCPDVVVVVLDDVGFAQLGCYGADIHTPRIDALAAGGVRMTGFHVTALCSPTRAALLTGQNPHAVGFGAVANWDTGFPGYRGRLPASAPTLASILRDGGMNTFAAGKWHLTPPESMTASGPYRDWPLGRGFDRYYGFLGAYTDHFRPELWHDNHQISRPQVPAYHLSEDLVDRATGFVADHVTADASKPYFLYLAFGACHAPIHVPREAIDAYAGQFEGGWDQSRESVFARQKTLGVIPEETTLPPANPGVRPWAELSADERRIAARWQEAYAAFMTHTDAQVGRLVDFLARIGRLDDTLLVVLSDNGASSEGGDLGVANYLRRLTGARESAEELLPLVDEFGGPTTLGYYPVGWAQAGNTPLRWYKSHTYGGGVRTPLIAHWPRGLPTDGTIRSDFHYVTDLLPTVLEATGIPAAADDEDNGQRRSGTSMLDTLRDTKRARRAPQYFEIFGRRGIWKDGWKAVTTHTPGTSFDDDVWALYHLDEDFSEAIDRAGDRPDHLAELVELWWAEAGRNQVLPLDDRGPERSLVAPDTARRNRQTHLLLPGAAALPDESSPNTIDRSYTIVAELRPAAPDDEGVLLSRGTGFGGFSLYVLGGIVHYEELVDGQRTELVADRALPAGDVAVRLEFEATGSRQGSASLWYADQCVGQQEFTGRTPWLIASTGGFRCGRDAEYAVSQRYTGPFAYTGALDRVIVTLAEPSGQSGVDEQLVRNERGDLAWPK